MIVLTTLRGESFALNEDLVEKVEADPETRVILTSGTRYIVAETVTEVIRRVRLEHAEVQVLAKQLDVRARQLAVLPSGDEGVEPRGVRPFARGAGKSDAPGGSTGTGYPNHR
jgi:flagellar protein FlbD